MNLQRVRFALADALEVIAEVNVNPYAQSQPVAPGIQIIPPGVQYDFTHHRGLDEWTFVVQGFVALNEDVSTQQLLDELCAPAGPTSVKAALEADTTLGGNVERLRVVDQSPGRVVERGSPMLLVEWRVQIFGKGDSG